MVLQSLQSDQLSKSLIGKINIAFTEWLTTSLDSITAGSCFECAGSLYYANADETVDSLGGIGAVGNNTIVYCYFNPSTLALYLSTTAPAFDDAKNGYYLGTSPTHRCIFRFYKVSAGVYNKKCILDSRPAIYLKQYDHELDAYAYSTAGTSILWYNTTNNVVGSTVRTTKYFYLKKPVSMYIVSSHVSGGSTQVRTAEILYIYQNGAYRKLTSGATAISGAGAGVAYCKFLNPAKYRYVFGQQNSAGNGAGVKRHTIYISGMYGGTSITKTACIDT